MVARLENDSSARRDDGFLRRLQFLQRLIFLVPKERFTEGGKNIRNRFSIFVADRRIGIDEAERPTASNFPSDRRLPRPHETDQN